MKPTRLVSLLFLVSAISALAEPVSRDGIAVVGSATIEVKPAIAELSFAIDATAEVAGDAITRFEQSRDRATEALNQLQIPNAEIIQQAFSIGVGNQTQNPRVHVNMMHNRQRTTPAEVVLSQPITIRLSGIDKLERKQLIERLTRIIDTARDLGLKLDSPAGGQGGSAVRFLLSDPEKARDDALDAAFANASKRATKLAKLAGTKLGKVIAIESTTSATATATTQQTVYDQWGRVSVRNVAADSPGAFSSIPIRASVHVRFAIAD